MKKVYSQFEFGDITAQYLLDTESKVTGLRIVPTHFNGRNNEHSKEQSLPPESDDFKYSDACDIEPLVLISAVGSERMGGLSQGQTMRNGSFAKSFTFDSQKHKRDSGRQTVVTRLKNQDDNEIIHTLSYREATHCLISNAEFINNSNKEVILELLSAFSLTGISPLQEGNSTGPYIIHRFRSGWSLEGRMISESVEQLELESTWCKHSVQCERFGQTGSLPVRRWFPFVAIEDTENNLIWGAKVEATGSWQMEIYRKDDFFALAGGPADREFGHWTKKVEPGRSFFSGSAWISVACGTIEEISQRVIKTSSDDFNALEDEQALFPVFNEWCTTWGNPSEENLTPILPILQELNIPYLVIDAGWYADSKNNWSTTQGDWNVCPTLFPDGLKAFCDKIRSFGITPGLWFEPESVGEEAEIRKKTDWLLKLDGNPIKAGPRYFFDFRNEEVREYLEEKLCTLIAECGLGYIKVDYNETIGIGCDNNDMPGEGLRQHLVEVRKFYQKIKEKFPELIIENCASGGNRLAPSFIDITDLSSFSDAHECKSIPLIAGNLQFIMEPSKSLIWAVLQPDDNTRRLYYSLASLFLGRVCLSGQIHLLSEEKREIVKRSIILYEQVSRIINNGISYRHGDSLQTSYNAPCGWQAIVRYSKNRKEILIVLHTFQNAADKISIPLNENKRFRIKDSFGEDEVNVEANT